MSTTASHATRTTRHLHLAPPQPSDLDELHRLLNAPDVATTWRRAGRGVGLSELPAVLSEGVAVGLVARRRGSGALAGLVELVDHDEATGTAHVAAAVHDGARGSGLLLEALAVLLDEGIARLGLRKAYAMLSPATHDAVATGLAPLVSAGVVTHEGTLRAHRRIGAELSDVLVLGIWPGPLAGSLSPGQRLASLSDAPWRCTS